MKFEKKKRRDTGCRGVLIAQSSKRGGGGPGNEIWISENGFELA